MKPGRLVLLVTFCLPLEGLYLKNIILMNDLSSFIFSHQFLIYLFFESEPHFLVFVDGEAVKARRGLLLLKQYPQSSKIRIRMDIK